MNKARVAEAVRGFINFSFPLKNGRRVSISKVLVVEPLSHDRGSWEVGGERLERRSSNFQLLTSNFHSFGTTKKFSTCPVRNSPS